MSSMNKKLNNKKGATIVLALLLLLVALTVGILLLTSSVTTIKQISSQKDEQQAYLSVSSAAQMIIDDLTLAENSYSGNIDKVYSVNASGEEILDETQSTLNTSFAKGMFGQLINNGIKYMTEHNENKTKSEAFEIYVDGVDLDPVKGTFEMNKGNSKGEYTITVELEDTDKYRCTLSLTGVYSEDDVQTFDRISSGTDIVSEDGYYKVEDGTGHYTYKESVQYIGDGKGNRSPKSFVLSDDGDFLVTYKYKGKNQGNFISENEYFTPDKTGDLQAVYESVDVSKAGTGTYTYLHVEETAEKDGEYNGEFSPYDQGEGEYNATNWEYTNDSKGDSQGIYVYNSANILKENHYSVDKVSSGKDYNAIYAHVNNNSGQYDIDLVNGEFVGLGGDFKRSPYYYIDGYTGKLSGLDHYSALSGNQKYYKNQYNGVDSYEKYIKNDSASAGSFIRVSKSAYNEAKTNFEPDNPVTIYLTKYNPTKFYDKLDDKKMITGAHFYDLGSTIYYKEADSDEIKKASGSRLMHFDWGSGQYQFDVKGRVYSYGVVEDKDKPKFPSGTTYYYFDSSANTFTVVEGSVLESNRTVYNKDNVYVQAKAPYVDVNWSDPVVKIQDSVRHTTQHVDNGYYKGLYKYTTENLNKFYYIDVGAEKGEYKEDFSKGTGKYIRLSESEFKNLPSAYAYEYVGDGNQTYCPTAYVEKTNGSYKIDYFVYSENKTGKFSVKFKKDNSGKYGLKELIYVKTGGDHKASEFELADPTVGGNYHLSGYEYVKTGGNFKVKDYQPGKGDFNVIEYIGSTDNTGDHRAGNYKKVADGTGNFIEVFDLAPEGTKGNYAVSEWQTVENGDYLVTGGSYVSKAGGDYEKIAENSAKYRVHRTPVRLAWNDVEIKKGGKVNEEN